MLRYLKAMLIFARYQARATGVDWRKEDAAGLVNYLATPSGVKFIAYLNDSVLRQQAKALSTLGDLQREAGYCNGQVGLISTIEALAGAQFPDAESDDPELHLNP